MYFHLPDSRAHVLFLESENFCLELLNSTANQILLTLTVKTKTMTKKKKKLAQKVLSKYLKFN